MQFTKIYTFLTLVLMALCPLVSSAQVVIASNDFDAPVGLLNTVLTVDNPFMNPGDIWDVTSSDPPVPFALVDDTNPACPGFFEFDTQGAVACDYPGGNFFGMVDTENPDNMGAVSGEWTFDISDASALATFSLDVAAMGDFEASPTSGDVFTWTYSIDGGPFQPLLEMIPNEAIDAAYTLFDGDVFILNDPMEVNGNTIINEFETITVSMNGSGNEVVIRVVGMGNGGSEALAWDNMVISGFAAGDPIPTMSQWGMFLFALIMVSIGLVFVYNAQSRLVMANGISASTNSSKIPFDKSVFQSALKTAMALAIPGFALIYIGWGEIVSADFIGMALTIPVVAYLIHVVKLFGKND